MAHVVTQPCCADASCVYACPVNCIHPAPGEPGFGTTDLLHVDPATCVDCGACTTACPVGAIVPDTALSPAQLPFLALNADYYRREPHADRTPLARVPPQRRLPTQGLRVAVVGAGPAGLYAADALLDHPGVRVDVYDRLPTPYGLARAGVAPDHPSTKRVSELFRAVEDRPGFSYRLGVEVGRDVSHDALARGYAAVVHAVGASADRTLGVPGEDLPGCLSATALVGWYNGHPDAADLVPDLSGERVVVVGNGNVALDVARVLTADPARLARTDIADRALAALRASRVREVVVLGRRGPAEAACTLPELLGLAALDDVDVLVEGPVDASVSATTALLAALAARTPTAGRRRIVLRFRAAPVRVVGCTRAEGLEVARTVLQRDAGGAVRAVPTASTEVVRAGLVLRSVGSRGLPVPGLPFDPVTGTVPSAGGRVRPGVYVAGWVKRGRGGLGANRSCSAETVAALLDDLEAGLLPAPTAAPPDLPGAVTLAGWRAVDAAERAAGAAAGRPRVKIVDRDELLATARRPAARRGVVARLLG